MEKIVKKKILVIGVLILFLGASATLGASAAFTNGPMPRVMKQNIQAINKDLIGQTSFANVKISDNTGNDYHPKVTTTAHDQIVVAYEKELDIFSKQVPIVFSADGGLTWTEAYLYDSIDFTSGSGVLQFPDIIYNAANDLLFLSMIDPQAEMYNNEMSFIPGDIATGGDAAWYGISGTGAEAYTYAVTACTSNFFYSAQTYDDATGPQIFGLGIFTYPDFEYPPGVGGFYYDAESLHVSHPNSNVEMDSNNNRLFLVSESGVTGGPKITMKTNVADETLITSGEQQNGMDKYADIEQWVGSYLDVGTDPDVSGSGSKVAVVYVSPGGEVKCTVSNSAAVYDPAFSWSTTTVDTGSAPAVYMLGNNVYVAYVKGGNLYMKTSSDGGATFGAAEKKNDVDGKVIGEPGSVDLGNGALVWTDNRDGNYDIYFAAGGGGAVANVVIDSISGGMGISAVLKNTGKAAAENFAWSIKSDGPVFVGKEKSGTATLQPGASTTVKTGLMLGIGAITITVTADTATKTADAKILLFFVVGL